MTQLVYAVHMCANAYTMTLRSLPSPLPFEKQLIYATLSTPYGPLTATFNSYSENLLWQNIHTHNRIS